MLTPEPDGFASLQRAFLRELESKRFSKSLLDRTRRVLPELFFHLSEKGVSEIHAVTERELESFAAALRDRSLSAVTQEAYISVVRRFFASLERQGVLLRNPARALRAPRAKSLPKVPLTEDEVSQLLEAPSPHSSRGLRDRAILELLYGTALRRGECVRLDVSDVDLYSKTLLVRDGKGKKDRFVPIPGKAVDAALRYLEGSRPHLIYSPAETAFFIGRAGRRVSESLIALMLRQCAKAVGIDKPVHPHALRRACATHLLQRGASVRHVQELLGHASIDTTTVYTEVALADLRAVLLESHPRERR